MKKIILGLLIGTGLIISGCTTLSKPLTFNQLGQFTSLPLNSNIFRIGFQTNANISYGSAEEIALLKAAQTTVQNGFQFFKVMSDPSNTVQQPARQAVVYPAPVYYPPNYYHRYPGYWSDPFYNMPQVINVEPAQVAYTIECFKNQKTAPNDAFDAALILKSLGPKYGLSPTGEVLQPSTQTPTKK
ncbi:hypothetical protein B9T31_01440 [Acinetobacter sp. ANC 4558]|uniref:CC0125/CC1285 family lipoprotein n=1 Tax=Acinetobacter sp. ANC 4558 TaxID=1977876 RepID=UPI000A34FBFE|nr:hypothetical protein [Acinetobacter sp. ANC 4558]OTG88211.1 hypothetical protein B9T31_01440 [Acinetobacter sp. ANC 4558]